MYFTFSVATLNPSFLDPYIVCNEIKQNHPRWKKSLPDIWSLTPPWHGKVLLQCWNGLQSCDLFQLCSKTDEKKGSTSDPRASNVEQCNSSQDKVQSLEKRLRSAFETCWSQGRCRNVMWRDETRVKWSREIRLLSPPCHLRRTPSSLLARPGRECHRLVMSNKDFSLNNVVVRTWMRWATASVLFRCIC